jgi:DNA-binding CsgD family transcriptional regulator
MRREGRTYGEIGKELNLSSTTVARAIRENSGLKGSMFNFDVRRAVKMRREGHGFAAIAKAVGVSRPTVTNAIKLKLLSSQIRRPRFDLARAIQMRREPKSYRAIARELGVSIGTIAKHLHARVKEIDLSRGPRSDEKRAERAAQNGDWVESISTQPARPAVAKPDGEARSAPAMPSIQLGRPPKHSEGPITHRPEASRPHLSHHAHHAKNP